MQRLALPVFFCFYFVVLSSISLNAQNSVGIGTNTPNQNAVLELVSTNGDQGLLVPKLTTSQRTASTFVNGLTSNENGLLVYDSDENQFYYWQETQWQPINTGGGDADSDPQNEIQDLQLAGNTLTITNNGSATPIDLSGLAGVDSQTLAAVKAGSDVDVSISNGNSIIVNVDDNDSDPGNELQVAGVVPVTPTGNLASTDVQSSLEELQGDIDLDLDQDSSNEIQNISISGNSLGIDGGGSGFDLTPLAPSANQVLKWDGVQWIAGSDDTGVGTLPALANAQILTNNGSNIAVTISGDLNMNNSGLMTIQPDAVSSTEIVNGSIDNQDVSAVANISATKLESTVVVQGENVSQLLNDSGYLTTVSNADIIDVDPSKISQAGAVNGEVLKWNNGGGTWEPATDLVDDADNNSTNEIQDLSLGGNTLSLTNDITPVDLSPYLDNTDSQNAAAVPVTPSGNLTSADVQAALVELQGDIDTDTDSDPTNEYQDLSIATDIISLSNSAGTINLVPYLDNTDSQNAAAVPVTPSGNLTSADVQAALVELQGDIDSDTDSDPTNEFQDLSLTTDIISLSNSAGTINLAPYLDNTDSQIAAAVPVTPSGNLTSVEVQAALEELQGDIDLDTDTDNTNEFNLGGSLEANNILRVVDTGGNTDIDISRLTGDLDANTNRINNLVDPAVAQDAATKAYVDNEISSTTWGVTGNSGTNPASDYVGTTDAQDLVLGTNGTPNMRINNANGDVVIGSTNAYNKFSVVDAVVAGADQGAFIDIHNTQGLNNALSGLRFKVNSVAANQRFGAGVWHRFNPTAYELVFAVKDNATSTNVSTADIKMVIRDDGNIGINNLTPSTELDVGGTIRSNGIQLTTTPTSGYVLTSNATGIGSWQPVPAAFNTNNRIPRGNGTTLVDSDIYNDGAGHIGINAPTPTAGLHMISVDGARFSGAVGAGTIPATGAGTRMMWYPRKAAFRVGRTTGTDWDDANIANYSVALGYNGIASGEAAVSIGYDNDVQAFRSVGIGTNNIVNQQQSVATGVGNTINGQQSLALGFGNLAGGQFSGAFGWDAVTSQDSAFALGAWVESSNIASYVIGKGVNAANPLVNNIKNSLMIGFYSTVPTFYVGPSFGFGSTGSVGIATSSPQQKLDVNGAIKIGNGFSVPGSIRWDGADFSGHDGSQWVSFTGSSVWNTSGSDTYYDAGQVSVGNTSPIANYKMEIEVPVTSPEAHGLYIDNTYDATVSYGQWISMDNDGGSNSYGLIVNSTGAAGIDYGVYTFGEDRNYFQGSVGINDLNPSEALEVNGNIVGESLRDYTSPNDNYISWDPGGDFRMVGGLTNTYFYGQTDGKVRIGTQFNSGSSRLLVQGFGFGTGEGFKVQSSLGTSNFVVRDNGRVGIRRDPTTYNLEVQGNAGKTSGGVDWVVISDQRLKKDIEPFSDGLERVLMIEPVSFRYNELAPSPDKETQYIGVLAQEIKQVFPYMVQESNDVVKDENGQEFSVLNYDNSAMTFILINAIKELNDENRILKKQLQKQDQEISKIYSLLDQINRKTNVEH